MWVWLLRLQFTVCHFNRNSSFFIWQKNIGMWELALPSPRVVWIRWENGCEVLWKWKSCIQVVDIPAVCVHVCARVCVVCTIYAWPSPWQWHQHWLSLFRLFLALTTTHGETMAGSSWPSPKAWKPTSWSKCLWWSILASHCSPRNLTLWL